MVERLADGVAFRDEFGQQRAGDGVAPFRLRFEDQWKFVKRFHEAILSNPIIAQPLLDPPAATHGRSIPPVVSGRPERAEISCAWLIEPGGRGFDEALEQ